MRYEHTPRPDIEHHHHIRELMEQQDRRVADRELHRAHAAALNERRSEHSKTDLKATLPFWCARCREDFMSETIRQDEADWEDPSDFRSLYKAKCPKGHWCVRLAMDKVKDPYFMRSRLVARERGEKALDILQPFESGYDMLYRRKNQHRS